MRRLALLSSVAALGYASNPPAAVEPKKPRTEAQVTAIHSGITMPETSRRGGAQSPYNFDALEVGQAFGVKNKDKRGMSSAISNANRKYTTEATNPETNVTQKIVSRHFAAFDVDAAKAKELKGTPLEGSKVLVFRDK